MKARVWQPVAGSRSAAARLPLPLRAATRRAPAASRPRRRTTRPRLSASRVAKCDRKDPRRAKSPGPYSPAECRLRDVALVRGAGEVARGCQYLEVFKPYEIHWQCFQGIRGKKKSIVQTRGGPSI